MTHGDQAVQTILVADSNPANLDLFEELLSYDGFEVVCTNNGEETLTALHRHIPNLLITELALPKVDGIEIAHIIRDDPKLQWMPLMAITALRKKNRPQQIEEADFDDFLVKPFKEQALMEKIKKCLQLRPTPANILEQRFSNQARA